jgi:hypothetical protein
MILAFEKLESELAISSIFIRSMSNFGEHANQQQFARSKGTIIMERRIWPAP